MKKKYAFLLGWVLCGFICVSIHAGNLAEEACQIDKHRITAFEAMQKLPPAIDLCILSLLFVKELFQRSFFDARFILQKNANNRLMGNGIQEYQWCQVWALAKRIGFVFNLLNIVIDTLGVSDEDFETIKSYGCCTFVNEHFWMDHLFGDGMQFFIEAPAEIDLALKEFVKGFKIIEEIYSKDYPTLTQAFDHEKTYDMGRKFVKNASDDEFEYALDCLVFGTDLEFFYVKLREYL